MRFCSVLMLMTAMVATAGAAEPAPVPLNPEGTVLVDQANKKLLLKTKVCLRQGLLEMLICPKQTKEHESILTIDAKAAVIHAGLLAIGAKPGTPARFQPEFQPPKGQQIDIFVSWEDEQKKKHRIPAQEWVRTATRRYYEVPLATVPSGVVIAQEEDALRYDPQNKLLLWFGTLTKEQKAKLDAMSEDKAYREAIQKIYDMSQPEQLKATFLFTGSAFRKRDDGKEMYLAEAGSLICVANFSDAMIDISIPSTASNDAGLLFEPWTERIPALGTEITVELIPVAEEKTAPKDRK